MNCDDDRTGAATMDFRNGDAGHDAEVPTGDVQVSSSDLDTATAPDGALAPVSIMPGELTRSKQK